jgi:hypothetical protein
LPWVFQSAFDSAKATVAERERKRLIEETSSMWRIELAKLILWDVQHRSGFVLQYQGSDLVTGLDTVLVDADIPFTLIVVSFLDMS